MLYPFEFTEQGKYLARAGASPDAGFRASFAVWGVLAFNTHCVFAVGTLGQMPGPLLFYTRYVLPLAIVGVPYL